MNNDKHTSPHTCQQLGLCQWRSPACDSCPNQTAPLAPASACRVGFSPPLAIELLDEAPTWLQVFKSWLPPRDTAIGLAMIAIGLWGMGHNQQADENARIAERAQAEKLGYQKGYNVGSSAGLKAAHKTCYQRTTLAQHCDWLLANTVVAYADEVQ